MSVGPMLRLSEFQRLDEVSSNLLWVIGLWIRVTAGLTALALLLSLAGIYAVLSFTVAAPDGRMKTAPFPFAVSIRRRFHSPFPFALSIRPFHSPFLMHAAHFVVIWIGAVQTCCPPVRLSIHSA
jgi:hypothetical protein